MSGSPPVQTPVLFLQGGGAAIFSADCVKALNQAGYNPEWFGSYNHVRKQITAAKDRVAAHDAWVKNGKKGPEPQLQPNDRYLANCQSGHISQDATHRQAGGRDNPCANLEHGYDTSQAPCMPQTAGPWDPPGSEHNVASRHEVACALRPPGPGKPYDPAQREKDEKERLDLVVNKRRPDDRAPITPATSTAGAESAPAPGSAGAVAGAQGKDASKPSVPDEQKIQGKDAVECIDNFKKAAMQAMRSKVTEQRMAEQGENRATANGGPRKPGESEEDYRKRGEAHRQKLRDEADKAEAEAKAVQDERVRLAQSGGGQTTAAKKARAAADAAPDDQALQDKARARGEAAGQAKGQVGAADSAQAFMDADAAAARNRSNAAERAHCEANEGAKLAAMTPEQRAAGCVSGMPKGPPLPEARTPNVSPETRADFNRTQADDPAGRITP